MSMSAPRGSSEAVEASARDLDEAKRLEGSMRRSQYSKAGASGTVRENKGKRRRHRRPGPASTASDLISRALEDSCHHRRGRNALDKRFRYHVLGCEPAGEDDGQKADAEESAEHADALSDEGSDSGAPSPAGRGVRVPNDLYPALLGDDAILRDVMLSIQLRVAGSVGARAKVILGGSTGMRMEASGSQARIAQAFPVSDIDIDVYAADCEAMVPATRAADMACADLLRDPDFVQNVVRRLPGGITTANCRTNSRVYALNRNSQLVSVDVPALADDCPRFPHQPLFATRNDSLGRLVLHRLRLACRSTSTEGGDLPKSIPIVDIKTRIGSPPPSVQRVLGGINIRVPSARSARAELQKLLQREYQDVDESKDDARRAQLLLLDEHPDVKRKGKGR